MMNMVKNIGALIRLEDLMAFSIDAASPSKLPMRGGSLTVGFRSREDAMQQKQQYLPLQSLFVESDVFPQPFSELMLTVAFPHGDKLADMPARVIQVVEFGEQRGFLVQIMGSVQALSDKIDGWPEQSSLPEPEPQLEPEPEPEPKKKPWQQNKADVLDQFKNTDEKKVDRMTLHEKLRKLNVNERARLASRADKVTRSILLRDIEPQVIMFMLKNPHITRGEIIEITKSPRINYNIAKIILSNKVWARNEEIRFNLTVNPKTPLPEALKLLSGLNLKHLRAIAKNQGMRTRIKNTALRLVLERSS